MRDQEIIGLWEAYQQVHSQPEEVEQLDEGHGSRTSFKKQSADERGRINMFKGSKIEYTPHKNYDPEANRGQGQILRPKQAEKKRRKELAKSAMGEGYDIYDVILSHLLDEGYADTNEAALAIMANMSEEWKQDIMEISDKKVIAARNALAKRTDKANARNDGNAYSRNVSREARMNARIQSRNQRTGSNVEPTFTRRHQ